jgi:prepilin-type N-terminal cleavage/methylation domain-containing protein
MSRSRRGATLIELLVVLALIGITSGVAAVAVRRLNALPDATDAALDQIAAARHEAIEHGRDVSIAVTLGDRLHAVTAHADGRVVADSVPLLDPMAGRPNLREATSDVRP